MVIWLQKVRQIGYTTNLDRNGRQGNKLYRREET